MVKVVMTGAALVALVLVAGPETGLAQSRQPQDREEFYCSYPRGGNAPDPGPYPCTQKPHWLGVRRVTTFCSGGKCAEVTNFGVPPALEPSVAASPRAGRPFLSLPALVSDSHQAP